jgi:hypothetical protein
MSMPENTQTLPIRSQHVEWSIGAGKTITVKDTTSGWFFPLNGVATLIWDMLDGTNDVPAIVRVICTEFEVDPERARTDVEEFIEQARDLSLIEVKTDQNTQPVGS